MSFKPIESYGLISNRRNAALISDEGSIDLYCPFGFDSPSLFARILDEDGGHFKICLRHHDIVERNLYFPDSNVLISRFGHNGVCEVWNFFAETSRLGRNALIRKIKGVTGCTELHIELSPRFNYGRATHSIEKIDRGFKLSPENGIPPLYLYTDADGLEVRGRDIVGPLRLESQEVRHFVLTEKELGRETLDQLALHQETELEQATEESRQWINRSSYAGRWQDTVNRSALTLRMMISKDHGAMVAAPSFGLPEIVGETFNWDYRFAWIRDNSLAFQALMLLGFRDDVRAFVNWIRPILHDHAGEKVLQPVFGLDYRKDLSETNISHWSGFKGSSPVRIGNLAWEQMQLDVYGELMRFLYIYDETVEPLCHEDLLAIRRLLGWVCGHWHVKGHSIWEERNGSKQHLYSKVMAWVALKSGIDLFRRRAVPGELDRWRECRDDIYLYIYQTFWNDEGRYFQRADDDVRVDASALIMPLVDFISITDPLWQSTLKKIEKDLLDDCLVHRFRPNHKELKKNYKAEEGTFCLCTFWYASCLAKAGRLKDARYIFERMLGFGNHLGLFSEELGLDGFQLGNFPLALTHAALISTALNLDRALAKRHFESDIRLTGNKHKEVSDENTISKR